jgi:hypothetical protein
LVTSKSFADSFFFQLRIFVLKNIMSLDTETIKRLELRDDSQRGLFSLLKEENLTARDLIRLKKQYEQSGQWDYKPDRVTQRLLKIEASKVLKERQELLASRSKGEQLKAAHSHEKPLPRSKEICSWKGLDSTGNVYWCNNHVLRHPKTNAPFTECGYHTEFCIGDHKAGQTMIDVPNKNSLCQPHRVAANAERNQRALIEGTATEAILEDDNVDGDGRFLDSLNIPGVVFARAGTKRHPLAPGMPKKAIEVTPLDEDEDDEEDARRKAEEEASKKLAIKKKTKGKWRQRFDKIMLAIELPHETRRRRNAAAAVIQARLRALIAIRVVNRMKREVLVNERIKAAILVQRAYRRLKSIKLTRAKFVAMTNAASTLQRWYRYVVWSRKRLRDQELRTAAAKLIRWFRLRRTKFLLKSLVIRAQARTTNKRRVDGIKAIKSLVRQWKFRRCVYAAIRQHRRHTRAVKRIQVCYKLYRARMDKNNKVAQKKSALEMMRQTIRIQKVIRDYCKRRTGKIYRMKLLAAAALLNRIGRGMLGRLRAARQRANIEAVWKWLAPTLPREMYAEYLGFADYDRQFDLSKFIIKRYTREGLSSAGSNSNLNIDTVIQSSTFESKSSNEYKSENEDITKNTIDPFDDDSPESAERREKIRSEQANKSGQIGNVFGTVLGKTDTLQVGGLTETEKLQAMVIEKEKRMKQKAQQANYELMKRSSQPVPMGRDTTGKAPKLIQTLAEVTKSGRQPLAPPPKSTIPISSKLSADIIAYLDRLEKEFLKHDTRGLGFVPSKGFQRILEASGTILTERLWKVLFETFVASGSDKVSYKAYLQYARRLDRPCPSHRVLVCPACIYAGPCDKCLCKRYESEGDVAAISNPHSEMCLCGHHKSRHAPSVRVHPEPPAITGQSQESGRPPETQARAAEAMPAKAGFSTNKPGLFGSVPHDIAALGMAQKAFSILPPGIVPRGMSAGDGQLEIGEMNLSENIEQGGLITRKVYGTKLENTVAIRALRGSNIIINSDGGLMQSRADELAHITDKVEEHGVGKKAIRGGMKISDTLPTNAVAHLTLPDLHSANDTLQSLARLSEREMKAGIAQTMYNNTRAIERMNMQTMSESSRGYKGIINKTSRVNLPLYDRAMQELDNMTYYGTPDSTVSRVSTSDILYNGPFQEIGTPTYFANDSSRGDFEFPGPHDDQIWNAPQPRPDSKTSHIGTGLTNFELQNLRPASGNVLADPNEWAEEALTYNSGTGAVILAVPRMTPVKGRRGRTPPFRNKKIPDHSPRILPTQKVLVPSMFVHAVAAGADVAAGAQEPTSQATAHVLEVNEKRQKILETDRDGSGGASSSLVKSESNGGTGSPSSRAMFTYLMILRSLALPSPTASGYDVVADPDSLLQLIVSHFGFLQVYWRDLIRDIRIGKLQGGPDGVLSEDQRLVLGQILSPNPGRASYLENVMRGQGLHKYQPNPQNSGQAITDLYFSKSISEKDLRELKDPGKAMPDRIRKKREEIARASAAAAASASPLRTMKPMHSRSNSSDRDDEIVSDLAAPQSSRRAAAAMSFLETGGQRSSATLTLNSSLQHDKLIGAGIGGLQPLKKTRSLGDAPPRGGLVAIPLPPPSIDELRRVHVGYAPPSSAKEEKEGKREEREGLNSSYTMIRAHHQLPFDRDFAPSLLTSQEELRQKERLAMGLTRGADEAIRNARAEFEAQEMKKLNTPLPTRPGMPHDPHYFKLQGEARPFMCRSPGCGATFGTLAAAVRHTKNEHTGVLPLFVSTETDAFLKDVWASAGLVANGWVPTLYSEAEEKAKGLLERKIAKKKNEVYSPKRTSATNIQLRQ